MVSNIDIAGKPIIFISCGYKCTCTKRNDNTCDGIKKGFNTIVKITVAIIGRIQSKKISVGPKKNRMINP